MKEFFKRRLSRIGEVLISSASRRLEEQTSDLSIQLRRLNSRFEAYLTLQAKMMAGWREDRDPEDSAYSIFSQFGEDGVLSRILDLLPETPKTFVEVGVEDYEEANTRLLASSGGWRGMVIDSGVENIDAIKSSDLYWKADLIALDAFVSAGNINELLAANEFEGEIGVLSIDIDGNDYWVWEALQVATPRIVICEYNSLFGSDKAITIPYDPNFDRTSAHPSNLYFGASLLALHKLAKSKGYELVAVEPNGVNAFFVHAKFLGPLKARDPVESFRLTQVRESRDEVGQMTFLAGQERLLAISSMPVVILDENRVAPLSDVEIVY